MQGKERSAKTEEKAKKKVLHSKGGADEREIAQSHNLW